MEKVSNFNLSLYVLVFKERLHCAADDGLSLFFCFGRKATALYKVWPPLPPKKSRQNENKILWLDTKANATLHGCIRSFIRRISEHERRTASKRTLAIKKVPAVLGRKEHTGQGTGNPP